MLQGYEEGRPPGFSAQSLREKGGRIYRSLISFLSRGEEVTVSRAKKPLWQGESINYHMWGPFTGKKREKIWPLF